MNYQLVRQNPRQTLTPAKVLLQLLMHLPVQGWQVPWGPNHRWACRVLDFRKRKHAADKQDRHSQACYMQEQSPREGIQAPVPFSNLL